MITAYTTRQTIDVTSLYGGFLDREDDRSGTVVMHHGMVKRPGKQIADFSSVELIECAPDVDEKLVQLAHAAVQRYKLNQVLLVHRLGCLGARDTVLVAIVSGTTRDRCFSGCQFLVDEIKKEALITLIEHGAEK